MRNFFKLPTALPVGAAARCSVPARLNNRVLAKTSPPPSREGRFFLCQKHIHPKCFIQY
jgi:hypothetical protein